VKINENSDHNLMRYYSQVGQILLSRFYFKELSLDMPQWEQEQVFAVCLIEARKLAMHFQIVKFDPITYMLFSTPYVCSGL
jgi:hypothetical protein